MCKENKIDFILAVGGGSVIDTAKAIAMGVPYEGEVWDFFQGKAELKKALPVGVILTIAAAGSESSDGTVITNEEGELKRPFASYLIYPKFAILNPDLTFTLPPYQTACGVADIVSHVMERYFTKVKNVDLSDSLCEAVMKSVILYGPLALKDPKDYKARAEIMWAGSIAHNNLLQAGRAADWGSHMIEHEISGIYQVEHGAGLAIVFPAWMKYVYKEDLNRFIIFAQRVWGVEDTFGDQEQIALEGIERLKNFFKELGLPISFKELDISNKRFNEMAEKATKDGPIGHFKKLYKEDVLEILELTLS